jgi:hypothetical protein
MPSSRPTTIPVVIHLLRQIRPRSILDVGIGFGKWGHLFREYTDINEAERDPARLPPLPAGLGTMLPSINQKALLEP